jgi:hypothetical protein
LSMAVGSESFLELELQQRMRRVPAEEASQFVGVMALKDLLIRLYP